MSSGIIGWRANFRSQIPKSTKRKIETRSNTISYSVDHPTAGA
jgi:hypothetical protein